jgi:hypothetical protein
MAASDQKMIRHTSQGKLLRQGTAILCVGLCAFFCMAVYQHVGDPTPSVLLGKAAPKAALSPLKVSASKLAEGDEADAEAGARAVHADKYVKDTSDGAGMVHCPILLLLKSTRPFARSSLGGRSRKRRNGWNVFSVTLGEGYIVAMAARAPGAQSLSRKTSAKHCVVPACRARCFRGDMQGAGR